MIGNRTGHAVWLSLVPVLTLAVRWVGSGITGDVQSTSDLAEKIRAEVGIQGGLIVHLGCGDGRLTASLAAGGRLFISLQDGSLACFGPSRIGCPGVG